MAISIPMVPYASNKGNGEKKIKRGGERKGVNKSRGTNNGMQQ